MNAELKENAKKIYTGLAIIAACEVVGAGLLKWSMGSWASTSGLLSGCLDFVLFVSGSALYGTGVKNLVDCVNKISDAAKKTVDRDVKKVFVGASLAIAVILFFPAFWLWDIFSFACSCWWSGFWNTVFACQAFGVGMFVFAAAFIGLLLPVAVWGKFPKA